MAEQLYVSYVTDLGLELAIRISYNGNKEERLAIGGMAELDKLSCKFILSRDDLHPRAIQHRDLGQIYFRTLPEYIQYIADNLDSVRTVKGEGLNCRAVQMHQLFN